ncbi:MAG: protein kinase [Parachlamydiales bacterium]|jgi:serine/threonine protein kinase
MGSLISTISTNNRSEALSATADKETQTILYLKKKSLVSIGKGAFGKVYKALGSDTDLAESARKSAKKIELAIKFFIPFQGVSSDESQLNELYWNFEIQEIPNTPKVLYSDPSQDQQMAFIITPYYGPDLRSQIGKLSIDDIEKIAKSLLETLKALEEHGIIHGDINGKNICFDGKNVTLIDFGSSLFILNSHKSCLITTSWYRAPEAVIQVKNYTCAIDMWSLGCFLFELYTGKALFPSRDENPITLMNTIVDKLGAPPPGFFLNSRFAELPEFKELPSSYRSFLPTNDLDQMFKEKSDQETNWKNKRNAENLLDLINKMITYTDRITPQEALLSHSFFNERVY